ITGERMPLLKRKAPSRWSAAEALFPDKEPATPVAGASLISARKLDDFKLHVEVSCQKGGSGGVLLRGRYRLQVSCDPNQQDAKLQTGAVYGFIAPSAATPTTPGAWEIFDVTLVGRTVTVQRNGAIVI